MQHKHDCTHLLSSISDYVDGELDESLCQELEQHLADCPDCRVVLDTTRKTVYLYHESSAESAQVPDDVRQRLFKCLNLEDYLKKG
jgi:anti-sigma factor (TIGR02949 family)